MSKEILRFGEREINPKFVWKVAESASNTAAWSIVIEAWHSGVEWKWNIHLYIGEGHPMFGWKDDSFYGLPFHGGVSLAELHTFGYHNPQYSWQKDRKVRKIGSDYAHDGDGYGECNPSEGVPTRVHVDAAELMSYMLDFDNGEQL